MATRYSFLEHDRLIFFLGLTAILFTTVFLYAIERERQTAYQVIKPVLQTSDGTFVNLNDLQTYSGLPNDPVQAVTAIDKNGDVIAVTKNRVYRFSDGKPNLIATTDNFPQIDTFTNVQLQSSDLDSFELTINGATQPVTENAPVPAYVGYTVELDANTNTLETLSQATVPAAIADPAPVQVATDPVTDSIYVATDQGNVYQFSANNPTPQTTEVYPAAQQTSLVAATNEEIAQYAASQEILYRQTEGSVEFTVFGNDALPYAYTFIGTVPPLSQVLIATYLTDSAITADQATQLPPADVRIVTNSNTVPNTITFTGLTDRYNYYTFVQATVQAQLPNTGWQTLSTANPAYAIDVQTATQLTQNPAVLSVYQAWADQQRTAPTNVVVADTAEQYYACTLTTQTCLTRTQYDAQFGTAGSNVVVVDTVAAYQQCVDAGNICVTSTGQTYTNTQDPSTSTMPIQDATGDSTCTSAELCANR